MDIVKRNYEALKQRYPEIYEKIVRVDDKMSPYRIIKPSRKGQPSNLVNTATGRLFYPEINTMPALDDDMDKRNIRLTNINIFLGAGLMYQVFAFYHVYKVTNGISVIIERRPEIFKAAMESIDLTEMLAHPNIIFIVGSDEKQIFTQMCSLLQNSDAKYFVKVMNFIEQPICFVEDKDYYINVIRAVKDAVREVLLFFGNDPNDSMIGIDNTFKNIEEIIENPGIIDLKDKFKGKPGIVVSTGPSLNKNVHLLKGLENKAVICGPDASLRVLRKHGLKPHMVTSLERLIPTSKLFENLDSDDFEDVYFAGAPVVHPQTYANYKGKRIIVYRNFATFKWLDIEKGTLDIGPSAGNMAFKVLEYMGCDPIILIGQDLAFGPEGNTHASGSTFGEKETGGSFNEVLTVEGNYIPQVKTTKVWNMFLNFYHKDVANSSATVINATEGGAKIYRTHVMTFKEAIDKYISEDIDTLKVIRENLHIPTKNDMMEQRGNVMDKVVSGLNICSESITIFDECYHMCEKFFNDVWTPYQNGAEFDNKLTDELITDLEKKGQIFSSPDFFNVLMHYVQSYFIRTMIEINAVKGDKDTDENRAFRMMAILKDMYAVMIYLVNNMAGLLEQLKTDLEKDMAEA